MANPASTVFITVPKYVAITPLPKIRPAMGPASPASSSCGEYAASVCSTDTEAPVQRGKKRRLDHLTWEEKIQRKKLKNRVAAQTSRDRKKARMEEMEMEISELTQTTQMLQNKCESLQSINDSLLEKNQKLDMELEALRQQLADVQEQQKQQQHKAAADAQRPAAPVATCAGCESILNGSAAGLTSNGLPVSTRATEAPAQPRAEKELVRSGSVEDSCPLPNLQDMLLFDEEFDAGKLEELAESLLADITADMEADHRECDEVAAQVPGGAERLPGPVVGTAAECLESGEHSSPAPECPPRSVGVNQSHVAPHNNTAVHQYAALHQILQTDNVDKIKNDVNMGDVYNSTTPLVTHTNAATNVVTVPTPETVYGTYDATTNSITIVMDDDTEPVSEAVEEIYCDGETPPGDCNDIKCPTPAASPSQIYLNVECSDDEDGRDMDFDPIEKFLCPKRPLVSPLAKSPAPSMHSATSDHGYESILGSPPPSSLVDHFEPEVDEFHWNNSFNDLFPTLL